MFSLSPALCCHKGEINYRWNTPEREREILKSSVCSADFQMKSAHFSMLCVHGGWPLWVASTWLPYSFRTSEWQHPHQTFIGGKLREMTSVGPVWCLISCSFSSNIQKSNMVRCCYTTLGCGVFSCMIREAQISSLWLGTAQCGKNFDSSVFLSAKCVRRAPALGVKSVTLSRICGLKHGLQQLSMEVRRKPIILLGYKSAGITLGQINFTSC